MELNKTEIDIIILSYAQNEDLKKTSLDCISSLISSENSDSIQFNILVIESEKSIEPFQYPNSKTIYPKEKFGYNKYMNIGIQMTHSSYVCLCNNDLIFHPNWATEIIKPFTQFQDVASASPICSFHHPKLGYKLNDGLKLGYQIRNEIAGWCLFFKRNILRITGMLDENYIFWCADNDYSNTLNVLKLNHVLVTSSIVDHLENKTLNHQTLERQDELTEKEGDYLFKKWNFRTGETWKLI